MPPTVWLKDLISVIRIYESSRLHYWPIIINFLICLAFPLVADMVQKQPEKKFTVF